MGLHTGEPISHTDRYVGLDVHRAARIGAAGHGGQILLSDAVSGLAARDLPPGVSLRDLGTHRLKDLREPEHLFQVVHPDLPADFPPLQSLDARPNNLPVQLTSFIGREKEIAEIKPLLGMARFVTLTGSGGAGKTRLALQVAADLLEGYPDGVWLAEFAPIADPALVPKTVASALNVSEQPGRDMIATLGDALRAKALLLVLDNCEHLLAACADLAATLLRACPQIRILATSREALGVPGESLWRVPSLSLPEDIRHLPCAEDLVLYDAVRLFVDRAVATAPGFTVTGENAPTVAQVCQRLDGIPLAIELAAARVKVLAVEQIAARLDDRFRLLTGGNRTTVPRQQTLRATMDWSFDLLSEEERAVLRRLSVFAGGWSLEAAEAICSESGVGASDILDLLTQLVNKSLVVAEVQSGEARYRLLETVRQYGRDRLLESGEAEGVRIQHRYWYLDLAERAEAELHGPEQGTWLERLETEHDNFRQALEWSVDATDQNLGLRLASALAVFWDRRGYASEGRGWLERALLRSGNASVPARAKALKAAGYLANTQNDFDQGTTLNEASLALYKESGDKRGVARCLSSLAHAQMSQGNCAQATTLIEQALALFRELRDKSGIGGALNSLGEVARIRRDYAAARSLYEESLSLNHAVGDITGIGRSLNNLAWVAFHQGDYRQAAALFKESMSIKVRLGWREGVANCLAGLGSVAGEQNQPERAAVLWGVAEVILGTIGAHPDLADRLEYLDTIGMVQSTLGEEAFQAARAKGRAMTLEQAIEYALAVEAG
jgi:predicted ATPase